MITNLLLMAVGAYVLAGVGFSAWFLTRGLRRVDPAGAAAAVWFRVMITPGVIALWPALLGQVRRAAKPSSGGIEKVRQ